MYSSNKQYSKNFIGNDIYPHIWGLPLEPREINIIKTNIRETIHTMYSARKICNAGA